MVTAYVLVKVDPGKENMVAQEIVRVKEITSASWTYGFCDIIFKVSVESIQGLDEIVFNKVRKIPGVTSTETIIVSPIPITSSRAGGTSAA